MLVLLSVSYPTSSESDRLLGIIVFEAEIVVHSTCWSRKLLIGVLGSFFSEKEIYLKSVSGCWTWHMKIWKIVRLWFDHSWKEDWVLISSIWLQTKLWFDSYHSFHYQSLLTITIFYDCSKVSDHSARNAYQLAFLGRTWKMAEVDYFCSKKLQDSLFLCCRFYSQALTKSLILWLWESWVSFQRLGQDRDEFQRP